MAILLITNNPTLINRFKDVEKVTIVNSIQASREHFSFSSYILVDSCNLFIEKESIKHLIPIKDAVYIIGNKGYLNFNSLDREELIETGLQLLEF